MPTSSTDVALVSLVDLPEDSRVRILQEERYRSEIRRQLEEKNVGRGPKVVRFFNSALGLWLLSTLVVSGLGTVYTLAKEHFDNERLLAKEARVRESQRTDQISRLDLEISFRLSGLLSYLHRRDQEQTGRIGSSDAAKVVTIDEFERLVRLSPKEAAMDKFQVTSLYQTNRDWALPSLLAELSRLSQPIIGSPGGTESDPIERSLSRLAAIPMLFERLSLERPNNARAIASAIQKEVILDRWRQAAFPFTDCGVGEPFC